MKGDRAARAVKRAEQAEQSLGNLLAIIHGDGGHYVDEHGWDKSVEEAHKVWGKLVLRAEQAETDLAAAREQVKMLREALAWALARIDLWKDYPHFLSGEFYDSYRDARAALNATKED